MGFNNAVDIANRAAQHCGVQRIADFTEDSLQASEFAFAYDKLRRAELRRNVWAFAIRHAALRPVDQVNATTKQLSAPVWSSTVTYTQGSIVSDTAGVMWQSAADDNLNNAPGNSLAWDIYAGPLTVQPYDTTGQTAYYAGELVYETPGDGTFNVYLSIASNNQNDPRMPSLWVNSSVAQLPPSPLSPAPNAPNPTPGMYYKDQVVMFYAQWASGTTYAAGNTVAYLGNVYISLVAGNLGNTPSTATAQWALLPVTPAPQFFNALITYSQGTFVTYQGTNYVSLQNSNTGNTPSSSPTFWVAQAAPVYYYSLIDFNLNNDPSQSPLAWSATTSYVLGNQVCGSDGTVYTSLGSNLNQNPTTTTGFWTNTGVLCPWTKTSPFGTAGDTWLQLLNVALTDIIITSPIGAGATFQSFTRNLYMLPANYLRRAPQDPKAGSISFLGAPAGLRYDDYEIERGFIVSRESYPIVLRFVADEYSVPSFDDMFCEGLAARMAYETVERLTQSPSKQSAIGAAYNKFMSEARVVNGIETGATEPPEDDYVTCRW